MTTFNFSANEPNNIPFNNLKALPSTLKEVSEFSNTIKEAKKKLETIEKAIGLRDKELNKPLEQTEHVFVEADKPIVNVAEVHSSEMAEPVVVSKVDLAEKPEKKLAKTENKADTVAEMPKQTKEKVVSGVEPVKEIKTEVVKPTDDKKTYVDDKGNIKVRKFLTDREPSKPTIKPTIKMIDLESLNQARRPIQPRPPYNNNNSDRPAYNNNNNYNNNGASRPPYNNNTNGVSRPPYNNNYNNNGTSRPPYNNNGTSRPPYNNNGTSRPNFTNNKDEAVPVRGAASKATKPKTFGDIPLVPKDTKVFANKKKSTEKPDDKNLNKRTLLKRSYAENMADDDDRVSSRRSRPKKEVKVVIMPRVEKAVVSTTEVQIKELSEKIGVTASEIIKQLFKEGIIKTINDSIDYEYAAVIASYFKVELELKLEKTFEEKMIIGAIDMSDGLEDNTKRAPIVTVMGHVDHGKTSLLDSIRKTAVTTGEAGGITQHIGAYTVMARNENITFIDTPGHEAFTAMRARGAQVTDIAIIVVAADDGVMPQTIEAINHAKAANVPIIVAINKMDKPEANPDRIKQQLTEHGILPEEWGGDSIMVNVSAKSGLGIDTLLESILLVAEMKGLKANPMKKATGTIIEAKLDKGRGPVATVLVQNGTLKVGDYVVAGTTVGKIRAMFDDKIKQVKVALPSIPVEVLGFSDVPNAGDFVYVVDEKLAKQVADERKNKEKEDKVKASSAVSLDDLFGKISEGQLKSLNIIIKSDVQGSLEALRESLSRISNQEVKVVPLHGGVGAITETDVMLAKASSAIIIAFNVRPDANAKALAEKEGVDIRLFKVIYDAVDAVTSAMKGMLAPKFSETIIGQVEVREVFKITGVGTVAGSYVTSGKITRNAKIRVYRDNIMVHDGTILALKRFKDDVKEVNSGYECGLSLNNYNDVKVSDIFEAYIVEEIKQ